MLSRSTAGQVTVNFLNAYYRAFVLHGELANSLQNFYGDTSRVSILGHPTLDGSASGKEIAMHLAKVDRVLNTRKVDIISVDTAPLPDGGIQLVCHGTVFQRAGKWKIIHVFVLSPTLHRHATYYISSEHLCFLSLTEEKPPEGVIVLDPRQVAAFLADDTKRRAEAQERRAAEAAQAQAQAQAQMQSHTQAHPPSQSHAQNQNQNQNHQQQQRHEQHNGENRFNRDGKNFRERRENNNNNNNSSSVNNNNNNNNNTENNNNNREHHRGERRDNQRDRRENNQQEDRRENREGRPARKQRESRRDAPPKDAQNATPADAAKTSAEGQQQQQPAKESKPRRERNKNRKDGAAGNNNNSNNNNSAAAGEGAAAGQSGKPANKPAANKPKPAAQVRSGPTKDIRIVNVPASVTLDTVKEVLSAKGAAASSVSRFGRDQAHVVVKFNSEEIAEKIYKNHATLELSGSSYKVAAFYA